MRRLTRARAAKRPTTCGTCSPPAARCPSVMSTWHEPSGGSRSSSAEIEPPEDRRLVQAYATWQVMRRLRASAQQNRARTPTANARNNIRAAASLLAWLRQPPHHLERLPAGRHRPVAAHRAVSQPGPGLPDLGHLPRARPRLDIPAPERASRRLHQPGPAVDIRCPAAARRCARPHRPGRRLPAAALRPAAVAHRRHDHQPGHPLRSGDAHPARPPRHARPRTARRHHHPAHHRRAQSPRRRLPAADPLAVPRSPARPPHHPGHARRTAPQPSASTPRPAAAPPSSTSPPSSPPPSSPTCSACTRTPPPSGCTRPEATGPAMQPS